MNRIKKHTISFKNAFNGLLWVLKSQPNYQIHLALSTIAIIGGFVFKITTTEWLVVVILITTGLTIESINSSIEAAGDAINVEWNEHIKHAKDASAAAMLIYAIGATICSFIIFFPKLISLFYL